MADNMKRNEQKTRAVLTAQFRLKQRLESIDFQHDVLLPELERFRATVTTGELPAVELYETDGGER